MKKYFWTFAIFAFCVVTVNATAQVTKGLHFYMPFNEGKGKVVKDVGPKGFEAELHGSAKFVKGKVGNGDRILRGACIDH